MQAWISPFLSFSGSMPCWLKIKLCTLCAINDIIKSSSYYSFIITRRIWRESRQSSPMIKQKKSHVPQTRGFWGWKARDGYLVVVHDIWFAIIEIISKFFFLKEKLILSRTKISTFARVKRSKHVRILGSLKIRLMEPINLAVSWSFASQHIWSLVTSRMVSHCLHCGDVGSIFPCSLYQFHFNFPPSLLLLLLNKKEEKVVNHKAPSLDFNISSVTIPNSAFDRLNVRCMLSIQQTRMMCR